MSLDNTTDFSYTRIEATNSFELFANALDHETKNKMDVTITLSDDNVTSNSTTTHDLSFSITNVPEAPEFISPTVGTIDTFDAETGNLVVEIDENVSTGHTVTKLLANDDDIGDTPEFYVTSGTGETFFNVNLNGQITTIAEFDYETQEYYTLSVEVEDDWTY